ncbi:MAG: hypothetical protein ABSE95_00185 [Thermodesulfobacteriota bacterium]
MLLVLLVGCGGTYGGTSTYLTITGGTWTKSDSLSTGDGTNLPEQLTFNANSTGSASGGSGVYATADPTFWWVYQGTSLYFYHNSTSTTVLFWLTAPLVGTVVSPMLLTTSTGGTATYTR